MKKVLFISYYFPPNAGSHVQRVAKFTKYLPDFGYKPIVLTSKIKTERIDKKLSSELTHIKKYYSLDLSQFIPGEIKKFLSKIFQPDKISLWRFTAVRKAVKIIKKENVELIFVSLPPHSVGYLASIVAKKTSLPLVVDFRDEWITFPLFEKKKHQILQKKMYYEILLRSKSIVTINRTIKKRLEDNLPDNCNINCEVVYNGFDQSDVHTSKVETNKEKITICYIGRFIHFHDPKYFFKLISYLLKNNPNLKNKIEFISIGDKETNNGWLTDFPLVRDITKFTGYLPLKDAYKIISESDASLLTITNYSDSSAFPLKMFDYIGLEKPIIAFLEKEDELYQFLKNYKASKIFVINNKDQLKENAEKFIEFINEAKKGNMTINRQYKKDYNREAQTKALSKAFNNILE